MLIWFQFFKNENVGLIIKLLFIFLKFIKRSIFECWIILFCSVANINACYLGSHQKETAKMRKEILEYVLSVLFLIFFYVIRQYSKFKLYVIIYFTILDYINHLFTHFIVLKVGLFLLSNLVLNKFFWTFLHLHCRLFDIFCGLLNE